MSRKRARFEACVVRQNLRTRNVAQSTAGRRGSSCREGRTTGTMPVNGFVVFVGRSFVPLGTHARSSLRGGRCAVPGEQDLEALTDGRGVRMTDTGQVPGEGLPENAGMVEQPGVPAPGTYTFLDPSENPAEDDDLLLMPGAQGAWGNEVAPPPPQPLVEEQPLVHEPGPHETAGRDSGSLDLSGVRVPGPAPAPQPTAPRRPLHLGPPTPDGSASPVRSLADRGPAAAPMATPMNPVTPPTPVRHAGPPTTGPEYLDVSQLSEIPPQGAVPWGAPPVGPEEAVAETVVPSAVQGPETGAVAEELTAPEAEV